VKSCSYDPDCRHATALHSRFLDQTRSSQHPAVAAPAASRNSRSTRGGSAPACLHIEICVPVVAIRFESRLLEISWPNDQRTDAKALRDKATSSRIEKRDGIIRHDHVPERSSSAPPGFLSHDESRPEDRRANVSEIARRRLRNPQPANLIDSVMRQPRSSGLREK